MKYLPGIAACLVLGLLAAWLDTTVTHGRVDAVTIALGLGLLLRALLPLPAAITPGVDFTGKRVLEVVTCALGATIGLSEILRLGLVGGASVIIVVSVGLTLGYQLGRRAGLSPTLSVLVATGNAVCGNSAILAVAPVVRAEKQDVASALAVTAVLGALLVLLLPFWQGMLGLTERQFGAVAGLTVYAVPQVLAATMPSGSLAVAVGTLVKLTRVALLGPIILIVGAWWNRRHAGTEAKSNRKWFPWYVTGFLVLSILHSSHLLPDTVSTFTSDAVRRVMPMTMAALGLQVDVRTLRAVGPRISFAVTGMLIALLAMSVLVIRVGVGS
ncbi:MAG TPA: putative sulfate exporter family transporter [Gemmatimonadales bacterium]